MRFLRRKITSLLLLVVLIGGAYLWQKDNITAIIQSTKYSPEQLLEKIKLLQTEEEGQLLDDPDVFVREITEEEALALEDGTLSREDLIARLVEPIQDAVGESGTGENTEYREKLSRLVAELLVLKSEYGGKLGTLLERAKGEIKTMSAAGESKKDIWKRGVAFVKEARELTKSGNLELSTVTDKITELMKEYNIDTSRLDGLLDAFKGEGDLSLSLLFSELLQEKE